jgi:hypothetical protein
MNKRACDRKFTCDVGRLPTPQPAPPEPPTESALGSNGCARFVPPPPRSWSRSRCRPAGWGGGHIVAAPRRVALETFGDEARARHVHRSSGRDGRGVAWQR